MTTATELQIVDGDSHVLEPPDLWDTYLEPEFRERSIRIFRDEQGRETLTVDNQVLLRDHLGSLDGVEIERERLSRPGEVSYLEGAPPASMDTAARI